MMNRTRFCAAVCVPWLTGVVAVAACGDRYDSATPEAAAPIVPNTDTPGAGAPGTGVPSSDMPGAQGPGMAGSGAGPVGAEGPPVVGGVDTSGGEEGEPAAGGDGTPPEDMTGTDGQTPVDGQPPVDVPVVRPQGPCDVYAAGNTPCVGAYSMVRALSSAHDGPLYQVRRGAPNGQQNTGNGGQTQDIGVLPNGFADSAAQIAFCANQTCTVSVLYDQSGQGNNLTVAKAGCYGCDFNPPDTACTDDFESVATAASITANGNAVYGLFMDDHEGYRNNQAVNTPEGEDEMGAYSVVAGTGSRQQVAPGCCWNFGIASRDNCFGPTGMMASLMFGRAYWGRGAGNGPWFMGDFEAGVWAGGVNGNINGSQAYDTNANSPSMTMDYAFGILKTRPNNYALRMGDAQQGNLTTAYDGPTPTVMARWQMDGGIILGIGGDNSNHGSGTFFEGVITAGRPSDATDEAVFRNVQAAGYGL